jgi:ubiquinone/menaquinone biosynthesis C-methylase UbiE
VSLYKRYVLPRLIDATMRHAEIARVRVRIVPRARGVVLEVGVGSGLNLPFYTSAVTRLYGVEPSAELLAMARPKTAGLPFPVEFLEQESERLPLSDATVDTVVITWSLCSIRNPETALREISRVLRPGGSLFFVEHGLAPDAGVQTWQNRLTPMWRRLAGGCHLNRKMDDLIRAAGFTVTELRTGYLPGPKFATYMYEGRATIDHGPSTIDH